MYDLILNVTYFFVAPNSVDVTSIVIEKLSYCNDHVRVTWKVYISNICIFTSCFYIAIM